MNCLEKYRASLVREINHNLRILHQSPEVSAAHDFRVGIKRLTALYYFLHEINPAIEARKILKPYRKMFKSIGRIRDAHIALELIEAQRDLDSSLRKSIEAALQASIRRHYRQFSQDFADGGSLRSPSIRSCAVSEAVILRSKPTVFARLRETIFERDKRPSVDTWHRKRILLKRYRHQMDAFVYCPGHRADEAEIKQIRVLEELLGDWHDRAMTIELLQSLEGIEDHSTRLLDALKRQDRALLAAAKIYLDKFEFWRRQRPA